MTVDEQQIPSMGARLGRGGELEQCATSDRTAAPAYFEAGIGRGCGRGGMRVLPGREGCDREVGRPVEYVRRVFIVYLAV